MNAQKTVLLLTHDPAFEKLAAEAIAGRNTNLVVAQRVDDALRIVCSGGHELDCLIIDFHGPHGMTLLTAISTLRHDLAIVAVTSLDAYYAAALAYANGAAACLAKPFSAEQLTLVIRNLHKSKPELVADEGGRSPCKK